MNRLLSLLWLSLKRPHLRRQLRRRRLHRVDGVPIVVLPEVHDPVIFRTGRFLARAVTETPEIPIPRAGKDGGRKQAGRRPLALDMGTGSGIAAIFAARRGYRVVGIDINPVAVHCARANVIMNEMKDIVHILQGDLFGPVAGTRFDLVTFNPPFFRGTPRDLDDVAWRSPDVIERFAEGLPRALQPDGRALLVFSSDGDEAGLLKALHANRLAIRPVHRCDLRNEVLTIFAVTHSAAGEPAP